MQAPFLKRHLLHPPARDSIAPQAFAGVRVHLRGTKEFTQPFGQLLQHAGEALVPLVSLQALVPRHGVPWLAKA